MSIQKFYLWTLRKTLLINRIFRIDVNKTWIFFNLHRLKFRTLPNFLDLVHFFVIQGKQKCVVKESLNKTEQKIRANLQ